jgi:hypothetical protein
MNTGTNSVNMIGIISNIVSVIAFIMIILGFKEKQLPVYYNEKLYFYMLFVLGLAMSTLAGFRDFPDGNFKLPQLMLWTLMLLGFLAFVLLVGVLFKLKIPVQINYKTAFYILSIIIVSKWILTRSYLLFKLFNHTMG